MRGGVYGGRLKTMFFQTASAAKVGWLATHAVAAVCTGWKNGKQCLLLRLGNTGVGTEKSRPSENGFSDGLLCFIGP
ncbi:hypothetical protein [Kingella potus]|uniref:hypothetical protein n=1 Tax=Kingella potus TaxID=265175 RepID=UPI001FD629BE|nr:hypothetical protein [Kingella potus]UOP00779.1 hypothetical protein LVJ84_13650 [Kingella potus]